MRVIVLGASSGLGRCIGIDRGKRGDQVALMARRLDRLESAVEEAGAGAIPIACDVTDETACRAAIDQAAERLGGIDAFVYATGVGPLQPIETLSAETWRAAFETNVIGAAVATNAVLPHLVESHGVAAYLSSVSASQTGPWPGMAAYNVSKTALDRLIEAYRVEHSNVAFTRVVVGDCAGGEGHGATEFANGWDMEHAMRFAPIWQERGLMAGALMDVKDLLNAIDAVLTSAAMFPSVVVTARP